MPLNQSDRTALRRELEAEGYSAASIQYVMEALEPWPDDEHDDAPADDAWAKQLYSTLACAATKL